jgi:predicted RNase H-like nuclease (RuvC/YqgF family)
MQIDPRIPRSEIEAIYEEMQHKHARQWDSMVGENISVCKAFTLFRFIEQLEKDLHRLQKRWEKEVRTSTKIRRKREKLKGKLELARAIAADDQLQAFKLKQEIDHIIRMKGL